MASLRGKLDSELLEVAALRIKLEAELASAIQDRAKAKSELEAASLIKQEADAAKKVARKVSTITCVNSKKLTWRITSVAPKCPVGYVRK